MLGLPLKKTEWTGDTDVDVGTGVAVGTLGNQALTCRWGLACHAPADAFVLAANKTESSITGVSCTKRNSDGPCFHIRNEGSSEFLLCASGRHPNVQVPLGGQFVSEGHEPWADGQKLRARASAVTQPRTIWPWFNQMCCSLQNSQSRSHRSGAAVSCRLSFWRTSNHHFSDPGSPHMLKKKVAQAYHEYIVDYCCSA